VFSADPVMCDGAGVQSLPPQSIKKKKKKAALEVEGESESSRLCLNNKYCLLCPQADDKLLSCSFCCC
jgi:hypothetical protein